MKIHHMKSYKFKSNGEREMTCGLWIYDSSLARSNWTKYITCTECLKRKPIKQKRPTRED